MPYYVNIPAGQGGANIFALVPGFPAYAYNTFSADVQTIMNGVANLATVNIQGCVFLGTTSTDYDATPLPAPQTVVLPAASGQFIWEGDGAGGGCGGPTGDGKNEFIFLRTRSLGAVTGGLTSMIVNPVTGTITECDVIYEAANGLPNLWGGGVAVSTGLPHEIGHFFGLDHTNLHPGGMNSGTTPVGGFSPTLGINYTSVDQIPAMASGFVPGNSMSRITNPWRADDVAGFSALYPVQGIGSKIPLTNVMASVSGRIVNSALPLDSGGVFLMNVYLIQRPLGTPSGTTAPPAVPAPPGVPPVGSVSGTAFLGPFSVTGVADSMTGAPGTGEFEIVGVPGLMTEYDVFVEPLQAIGMTNTRLSEWWIEGTINPTLNNFTPPNLQAALLSTSYGSNWPLPVGSITVSPGSVVRLPPIDIAAGITVDVVSRPVVEISPRNIVASPGQYLTITVTHNSSAFNGTPPPGGPPPLQSLSVTVNGAPAKLAFVSSTPTPPAPAGTPYITVYNSQIPMNVTYPAVVEAVALEVVGGIPSAPGVNRVRY